MQRRQQERVFRDWLQQYDGIMVKIARAQAATREDQDDLLQEILLQIWLSIPAFQGKSKESTWIYRVALNAALAWKRTERKRRRRQRSLLESEVPASTEDPDDGRRDGVLVERLYEEIRALPAIDSSLILLYLDDVSYREMAEILGISQSNVGVKLNRIKKKLFELLEGGGDET